MPMRGPPQRRRTGASPVAERKLQGWRPETVPEAIWSFGERARDRVVAAQQAWSGPDLRQMSVGRQDQSSSNSCAGQAVAKACEIKRVSRIYEQQRTAGSAHDTALVVARSQHRNLSAMAIYYLARDLMPLRPDGTDEVHYDEGAYLSAACDVLRRWGVCTEDKWPFDVDKIKTPVSWKAMRQAKTHKIHAFYRIEPGARVEDTISNLDVGNPVVYGTAIGPEWDSYQDGEVLGKPSRITGHHATVLLAYDRVRGLFLGENSWGTGWGDEGFYRIDPRVIESFETQELVVIAGGWEDWA